MTEDTALGRKAQRGGLSPRPSPNPSPSPLGGGSPRWGERQFKPCSFHAASGENKMVTVEGGGAGTEVTLCPGHAFWPVGAAAGSSPQPHPGQAGAVAPDRPADPLTGFLPWALPLPSRAASASPCHWFSSSAGAGDGARLGVLPCGLKMPRSEGLEGLAGAAKARTIATASLEGRECPPLPPPQAEQDKPNTLLTARCARQGASGSDSALRRLRTLTRGPPRLGGGGKGAARSV